MRWLIDGVYLIAGIVILPWLAWSRWRHGKTRGGWGERLGFGPTLPPAGQGRRTLLLHAVSVGEVNAIRELVAELERRGGLRLVFSSTTDTGLARARDLYGPRHEIVRYPLDFSWAVARFLDRVKPSAVALVELEAWPNFTSACQRRGVPVCVVNGRLSERSFRRYRKVRWLLGPMFRRLAFAATQNQAYAERFAFMGTPATPITDNLKWDSARVDEPADVPGAAELAKALGLDRARPIVVAGSTGPGEETLLIDACPANAQLVLVPRKPERFAEVAALDLPADAGPMVRRSERPDGGAGETNVVNTTNTATPPRSRVFLLDTMGELRKAYALADVCVIGRSFLGLYGSDPLEPAALGKPSIIGPFHSDFTDSVDALREADGLIVAADPGPALASLLSNPAKAAAMGAAARAVLVSRQGAARRTADLLAKLLGA